MRDLRRDHGLQLSEARSATSGVACGKAILVGEHFAVHGGDAVAVPIAGRSLRVTVAPGRGDVRDRRAPERMMGVSLEGGEGGEALVRAVEAMLGELGVSDAIDVEVAGDLPLGVGLGGSAALAAALVRALGLADGHEIEALVHRLEVLAHGRPSGIDGAVICRERPIRLRAGRPETLECHAGWLAAPPWWIALVPRSGSTREAVARVAALRDAEPARYERLAEASARDAEVVSDILGHRPPTEDALRALGEVFDSAHARLVELGVSNDALERLVAAARAAGAYGAKLSGGGMGGAVIAVTPAGATGPDLAPRFYSHGAVDVIAPRGRERSIER